MVGIEEKTLKVIIIQIPAFYTVHYQKKHIQWLILCSSSGEAAIWKKKILIATAYINHTSTIAE